MGYLVLRLEGALNSVEVFIFWFAVPWKLWATREVSGGCTGVADLSALRLCCSPSGLPRWLWQD